MDPLLSALQRRVSLVRFVPAGAGALVIAELFYKFHSFAAECLAFLATWFVLDLVREWLAAALRRANHEVSRGG